jgi:hypothetical protein
MFTLKGKKGFRLADGTFTSDKRKIHWYQHYVTAVQDANKHECKVVSMETLWHEIVEEVYLLQLNDPIPQSTSEHVEEYDTAKHWDD